MKTAVVTGVTGFVGSWVARALIGAGWSVVGLKRSTSDLRALGGMAGAFPLLDVDYGEELQAFTTYGQVDAVVHVATDLGRKPAGGNGGRLADATEESPTDSEVLKANVLWPLRLMEHARWAKVPLFINTDTCVPPDYPAMRPYALSKRQFVDWGRTLAGALGGWRFVNLRLCQPYGPRLRRAMFVPWLIGECLAKGGGEAISLTPGGQLRDFVYASDVAAAYLAVLEGADRLRWGFTHLDCGSGRAITVREFAEAAHRLTESKAALDFGALAYRLREFDWQADVSVLRELGWAPTVPLEDGLRAMLREDFGCR